MLGVGVVVLGKVVPQTSSDGYIKKWVATFDTYKSRQIGCREIDLR